MISSDNNRPRMTLTHRPTGNTVTVGSSYSPSMQRQRTLALKILRSMVAYDPPEPTKAASVTTAVVRKYDFTPDLTRIVDLRTGHTVTGDDVAKVIDGGEIDGFVEAGIRGRAAKGNR